MTNLSIQFEYPWLLLLLIPAVFLTLLLYFRRNKKYRRTRNRIVSIVLHTLVMLFCILTLSGVNFVYEKPNLNNEVILLVDVTDSGSDNEEQRNEFIQDVIAQSSKKFRIGIVTFGYDQVYAVPLTEKTDNVFTQYLHSLSAKMPDTTATDIASALNYASKLFSSPETAKIVLISDGIETDGSAMSVVKNIAADGIKLDTVFFPSERKSEVQLVDIKTPDYSLTRGDAFELTLTLQSNYIGEAQVTLHDFFNDEDTASEPQTVQLNGGVQEITFEHKFNLTGMHRLSFDINSNLDTELSNNSYYAYIDFQLYNKILIIDREVGLSDRLVDVLRENGPTVNGVRQEAYDITVMDINSEKLPRTLRELRDYNQVILNNIALADMPTATETLPSFEEILYSYVHDIGGGLFTISGSKTDETTGQQVANAFTREDMFGSLYQDLLPVQAINYTPPIGVVIIVDRSGSMSDTAGSEINHATQLPYTKLELAKEGAKSCLDALSERDYVGVMTLEDHYSTETNILPRTMENTIIDAINAIPGNGGGTVYSEAIMAAGRALKNLGDLVEKKHIILVSDGEPGDSYEDYSAIIKDNLSNGITFSAITIGASSDNIKDLRTACETDGGGRYYNFTNAERTKFVTTMREELQVKEIKDIEQREFTPKINDHTSVVAGIYQEDMPKLGGFYGTKKKEGADVPLMGEFVPIYAQWKHGEGSVGSFLCDLTGDGWSREFMNSQTGKDIIYNIVDALFSTRDITDKGLDVYLNEDNYTTEMSIILTGETLKENQSLSITITGDPADGSAITEQVITRTASDDLGRITFNTFDAGIYTITIRILDSNGSETTSYTIYKAFSYSAEYNVFVDNDECSVFLARLAENGKGEVVTQDDSAAVFDSFVRTVTRKYNPAIVLIVAAIVLFLLDIAVRKFKFKWLSEIIRDRKAAKEMQGQAQGGDK